MRISPTCWYYTTATYPLRDSTVITIQFDLDIDANANDVQAAINAAAARPRGPLRQRGSPCIVASTAKNSLLQKWLKTVDQTPQKESGYEGKRRNDTARSHGDPR